MNEKGKEIGLPDFEFVNTTGLENKSLGDNYPDGTDPDGTNLLSARSAALLAYHLVNDYPESLEISSIPERSEEHTSELQSRDHLVYRLLLETHSDGSILT